MKLRFAQPSLLIDISKIKDLAYIREEGGQVRIGSMTTHFQIETSDLLRRICPLLPEAATQLGDVQVRNKGTIGGSVAHADQAADWPAVIIALNAEIVAVSPKGERVIKADEFFIELMTTALEPTEVMKEIRFATPKGKVGQAYFKHRHPASGFAVVGIAVNLTAEGSKCGSCSIGVTGVSPKPYRAGGVERALKGASLDGKTLATAAEHVADGVGTNSDLYASAEYRNHLAQVYTRRALEKAASRAK
jgi:carbon-monoxide dehydrogenase medium subunit